ncbi:hypothetical protein SAMN05421874_105193 [Nonomuraea maritima]|uniref:Uncharacterized protein n=1 Tax=Nonomuraea maritima TaxID=683260 RepID=A0A1G8ZAS4_9ACTN|nr:hypothetical protein SAMN05421874_105193 [Nonomuraea maritima]
MVSVEAEQAQGSVACASTRPNQRHPRQRCRGRHPLWSAQNHQRAIHPAPARSDPCLASVDAASAGSAARTRRRGGGRLSAVGGAEEELFAAGAELVAEASEFAAAFLQFLHQGTEGAPVSEVGHRHPEHRNFTDERRPCLTLTGSTELAPTDGPNPRTPATPARRPARRLNGTLPHGAGRRPRGVLLSGTGRGPNSTLLDDIIRQPIGTPPSGNGWRLRSAIPGRAGRCLRGVVPGRAGRRPACGLVG